MKNRMRRALVPFLFLLAAGPVAALTFPSPQEMLSSGRTTGYAETLDVTEDGDMQLGMLIQLPPDVKTADGPVSSFRINLTVDCELSKWVGWRLRSYAQKMGAGAPIIDTFDEPPLRITWRDIRDTERDTVLNGILNQSAAQVCNQLLAQRINPKELARAKKSLMPAMSIPGFSSKP
ncbi:hypothetical protein [Comamonas thiooxydans]|uniref:hypothetical protein n=1 Tax=Comamonas thiooxydans TaxID=363952 RepID=UPI00118665B9|nr:hypothetical protein [Comamonas thiooxydans]